MAIPKVFVVSNDSQSTASIYFQAATTPSNHNTVQNGRISMRDETRMVSDDVGNSFNKVLNVDFE